uniref:ANK_REP_REGION domain-containing protein n=1 Tax=Trichobilharzia regenti TaxID=157069 RepID=A0AA85K9K7_TRIRE|nr:unnamed protein product [Trichobilharzia regenti]
MNHSQNGSPALDVKRIESARANRQLQLENWRDYERQMHASEKYTKDLTTRNPLERSVKFTDNCVLLDATLRGDCEEVEYLLSLGISPNISNVDGLTALHQACIDNDIALCNILLDYGANVNARDADLWTPLHAASTCGYLQICQLLIKHGGDLKACNADGLIPYDICDDEKTSNFLQSQMRKSGITPKEIEDARTAPEKKMLSDLKMAFSKGCNLNILDSQGAAPIHVAAACGYTEVALFLLRSGVDPDSLDADGWTPSHIAACWGELEMIKLFVSHGADLTLQVPDGRTVFTICDNDETHDEVCAIWNMREKLRSNVKLMESNGAPRSLRRRRSTSSVHRTSMRDKSNLSRREAREEAQFAHSSSSGLDDIPPGYQSTEHQNSYLGSEFSRHEYSNINITGKNIPSKSNGINATSVSSSPRLQIQQHHAYKQHDEKNRDSDLVNSKDSDTLENVYPDINIQPHSKQTKSLTNNHSDILDVLSHQNEVTMLSRDMNNLKNNNLLDGRTTIADKRNHAGSLNSSNPEAESQYLTNRDVYIDHINYEYDMSSSKVLPLPQYIDQEGLDDYLQTSTTHNKCCRRCTIL